MGILDYCGRKPCQSPKKVFFLKKKNLFCLSKLSIKINAPYYIHVFLLYIKDENLWRSCGFLYYSVIYINVCIQSNRMTYYSISLPSKNPKILTLSPIMPNLEHKLCK